MIGAAGHRQAERFELRRVVAALEFHVRENNSVAAKAAREAKTVVVRAGCYWRGRLIHSVTRLSAIAWAINEFWDLSRMCPTGTCFHCEKGLGCSHDQQTGERYASQKIERVSRPRENQV